MLCQVQKVWLESTLDAHDSLFLEGDALPALQVFYELQVSDDLRSGTQPQKSKCSLLSPCWVSTQALMWTLMCKLEPRVVIPTLP